MSPTDSVYAYEPIPAAMKPEQWPRVLGSQGQLWTEYMADMSTVEYMGFPRICALAEVLWLDAEKKNYAGFLARLRLHRERLDVLGVNAHPRP
jgi:hexosaminidase